MHYYQFNIGDYLSHTRHLTPIEDICYRRLLDWYYLHEKPIPNDLNFVARLISMKDHVEEVKMVLDEFFYPQADGWINHRADEEIKEYHDKVEASSRAGKLSALKRAESKQTFNERSTTVQPTNNHKPITNKQYIPPIPAELLSDYLKVRKAKKAGDLTETAFNGIANQAKLAGISVEDAIRQCCERGWVGFKAEWIKKEEPKIKESFGWRNDDVQILKIANQLGVHTSGKSRFEILALIDKKRGVQ